MTNQWGRTGNTANPKHSKNESVLRNKLAFFVQTSTVSWVHVLQVFTTPEDTQGLRGSYKSLTWPKVPTSKEASTQNSKSLGKGHISCLKLVLPSWKMQGKEAVSSFHRRELSSPPTLLYSLYWEVVSHSRTQMHSCLDDETQITRTCSCLQARRQPLVFLTNQIL